MAIKEVVQKYTPYFGIIGSLAILVPSFITGLAYMGRVPEQPYTIFTHFISELGEIAVSELAWLFNIGLIAGGCLLCLFIYGLQSHYPSKPGVLAMVIGCYSAISGALVGLFPMDYILSHIITAMGFFFGGMISVALFSMIILFDKSKRIPRAYSIIGLLSTVFFVLFLVTMFTIDIDASDVGNIMSPGGMVRPVFWNLPFYEWCTLLSILAWIMLMSVHIMRKNAAKST